MKIPTDHETKFMEPMTDEAIQEYAEYVVTQMDEDEIISAEGMEFISRDDNIPCESDQDRIMELIEELHNGQSDSAEPEATTDSEADGESQSASEDQTQGTEDTTDEVATEEAVVEAEVE